jgi:hypothetical protein
MASDQARHFLNQRRKKKRTTHPWGVVFNVDPIAESGSHWLALYYDPRDDDSHYELFDSYGSKNFYHRYPGLSFLKEYEEVKIKDYPRMQSKYTYVCGHYCLSFLWHRTRDVSLKDFVASFPGPPKTNDKIVCRFVCKEMIPKEIKKKL